MTFQQAPYLREQRQFPNDDLNQLAVQMDQAYIDIASKVNSRIIGTHAVNFPIITGEKWYLKGQPQAQQTLRQVYTISSFAAFNHGISFASVSTFTEIRGIGFDGNNFYPIPFTNPGTPTGQIAIIVTPTQVVFGTGVGSPAIVSGIVILEWLSIF